MPIKTNAYDAKCDAKFATKWRKLCCENNHNNNWQIKKEFALANRSIQEYRSQKLIPPSMTNPITK